MDNKKIFNDLIEYLYKKNIDSYEDRNELIWTYKKHYNEFKIAIYINDFSYNKACFKYYVYTANIKSLSRKRTAINNFNGVFKVLSFIKDSLDSIAEKQKNEIDIKKKYSTEIKLYYKRKHKNVNVSLYEIKPKGVISIDVNGYNKKTSTSYNIQCKDNKYYLRSEIHFLNKKIPMTPLK